jgi:hypothetical protein
MKSIRRPRQEWVRTQEPVHVEEGEELGVDRGESVATGKRRPGEAALEEGRKMSTSLGGNKLPSD